MSLFRADEIAIRFGGIRAVDAVSFEVNQGEVFSIIGPNGAGKTTIFNLISRIYAPTSGRLIFEDQDITDVPPYRIAGLGIARTFQNIELFANATLAAEPADRPALPLDGRRAVAAAVPALRPARGVEAPREGRGGDRLSRPASAIATR